MMSRVAEAETGLRRWKKMYGPIAAELDQCEEVLRRELRSDDPFVDGLVKHAFRLGGKRLRPALVLLPAKALGGVEAEHITLAAVVEMIHTATLVHDDVLDEATIRRHRETINARNDNEASVLVGDFLFTHAFALASSLQTTFACQTIGRATNIVCAGELRQIHSRGNFALSEAEYLDIIEDKTAELRLLLPLGGPLCACHARSRRIARPLRPQPGHRLSDRRRPAGRRGRRSPGRQIAGHRPGQAKADAARDSPSGPGRRSPAGRDPALLKAGGEGRPALRQLLAAGDALEYARLRATWYADQALEELRVVPAGPAREVLESLTRFVVARRE